MQLPPDHTARAATADDAVAVIALVNAAETVDLGEPMLELSDIETDWASLDLANDVVVVHDDDGLAGYAQVFEDRADADVHPRARGRGIGLALVEWTERRALAGAGPGNEARIGQTLPEGLAGLRELFVDRGYERGWDSWVLRLPPGTELRPRPAPADLTIRPYRPDEEADVHRIIDDAFSEWEGREPRSFEDWQSRTTGRPDFDPSLLVVAEQAGGLVGAAVAIHYPGDGWVDQVAVNRAARNQGIATALLATLFEEFRSRGEQRLGLNTDSRTGALDLYLGLGMEIEHTFTRWSKNLRG